MTHNNTKYRVKYDVGTNFDPDLIGIIDSHNASGEFETVFGKLRSDCFGGGRSSMILPDLSLEELGAHIKLAHSKKLRFNYLMNPYCLGNREVFPDTHREILAFIDNIVDLEADGVTVNSPFLCSLIKNRHPSLEVTIGLYSSIFTPKQVVEWKDLGADVLTLGHALNRDFPLLEAMMRVAKDIGIGLRLIANNICLRDCAYKTFHGTELSHSSQANEKGAEFVVDYCVIQCTAHKLMNPERLIASEWIRPEDVTHYEELCDKVGYDRLSIKLLDRIKTTQFIARVVKAYAERSYSGNLLDIMSFPGEQKIKNTLEKNIAQTIKHKFNPVEMTRMGRFFALPKVHVDNTKLDGFIDHFMAGNSCAERLCHGSGGSAVGTNSDGCAYCQQWAKRTVTIEDSELDEWKANANQLLESIKTSKLFTFNF